MNTKRPARRGYALILVTIFIVLFLAMLGMASRQVASVLRVETLRAVQTRRDQGCLLAVVKGIHYLEQNATPVSPYAVSVDGFAGTFTVIFSQDDPLDHTIWTITAVPTP